MKFEFVEFYPYPKQALLKKSRKRNVGTIHLYLIDGELDFRGIIVRIDGNHMFFNFPHFNAVDENHKTISYPFLRFMNENVHKEMHKYLQDVVRPQIEKRIEEILKK
jgi:heat shock protein HspQ